MVVILNFTSQIMDDLLDIRRDFSLAHKELQYKKSKYRQTIEQRYGDLNTFSAGLVYRVINTPKDPALEQVYKLYELYFPLADEKESLEGFEEAVALNNSIYQDIFGTSKEEWIVMYDSDGHVLGGVNFAHYFVADSTSSCGGEKVEKPFASIQIIYIFIKSEYRSLGLASVLLDRVSTHVQESLSAEKIAIPQEDTYVFCEQNAPERMSQEEYFTDAINSQIDPCDRLVWWHNHGYRRLSMDYIQPALSPNSQPCTSLTLNIKSDKNIIPGYVVAQHLRRFFTLSIFKGEVNTTTNTYIESLFSTLSKTSISTEGDQTYYLDLKATFYEPNPDIY